MKRTASVLALVLAGCAGTPPPPTTIIKYVQAPIEPECLSDSPTWTDPAPDQDETRSQSAWRENQNKTAFKAMSSERAACRAGLTASQSKSKGRKANG